MDAEAGTYREAPANIEVEQALLGAILINNDALFKVSDILKPDHFFEPVHRLIFETARDLIREGLTVNPVTIKTFLPEKEKIGEMTVAQYMARLASASANPLDMVSYARQITDLSTRRKLIGLGEEIIANAYHVAIDKSADSQIDEVERQLYSLRSGKETGALTTSQGVDMILAPKDAKSAPIITFPLPQLREVISGDLEAGNLYGMLSGSGEGKTSLVLQIVYHAASEGHPVLILSYDQSWDQCLLQMVSQEIGIEHMRLKNDDLLTPSEVEKKIATLMAMKRLPITYQRCSARSHGAANIAGFATQFLRRQTVQSDKTPLIVLDHVRKVRPNNPRDHEGRIASEVNGMSKDIASEFGAVWMSLNQRSTLGTRRKNPRPIDSDIFGGEMAREDYDAVFYLYRPWKYWQAQLATAATTKEEEQISNMFARGGWTEDTAELGALKVRFADPTIRRKIRFIPEYTRYASIREEKIEELAF